MEIELTKQAAEDLEHWRKMNDEKTLKRIRVFLAAILETPFSGIGKPETLKHNLAGYFSRRITQEHRLVYQIKDNIVYVHSLRGHY